MREWLKPVAHGNIDGTLGIRAGECGEFKSYYVSIRMEKLPKLIRKATKNKSRQSREGAFVVEVSVRDLPPVGGER